MRGDDEGPALTLMDETYYHVTSPDWQPGAGVSLGPDGRIPLFPDLESAVERAGDVGGYVLEVTLDPATVTKDPVELRNPFATAPIPPRRLRVLGT